MGTKLLDKKLISPERQKEIAELAKRNVELLMQGADLDDTPEELANGRVFAENCLRKPLSVWRITK